MHTKGQSSQCACSLRKERLTPRPLEVVPSHSRPGGLDNPITAARSLHDQVGLRSPSHLGGVCV